MGKQFAFCAISPGCKAFIFQKPCRATLQGPFDTAAELAGAFDSGSLRECTLPPWATSGDGAELGWALTLPFPPPRNATAASDAAAAVANGGLQSQVPSMTRA